MAEIVEGAKINETHANVQRSRSTFPLKQMVLDTHRFGEYHPHFVLDCVTSDRHPFRSKHNARSYTLKAPLMQDVQMHKDYFQVPLRAILPLQADRIITTPTLGDDVPQDAYTFVNDFVSKINSVFGTMRLYWIDSNNTLAARFTMLLKSAVLLESVFSDGSLLASLGCSLASNFYIYGPGSFFGDTNRRNVDQFFDTLIECFVNSNNGHYDVTIDGVSYKLRADGKTAFELGYSQEVISYHRFLQMIRDTSDWSFAPLSISTPSWFTDLCDDIQFVAVANGIGVDIARLWAYHLVCAEFFTNDKVDYIYSADLFRQYINALYCSAFVGLTQDTYTTFSWNGLFLPYDFLSAHYFSLWVSYFNLNDSNQLTCTLQYFLSLFGYKRSLRFKDYFTGSRTRPLAIGSSYPNSTDVPVVANNVSVIDVSRSIQIQRFLNAVNATGRKFEEYLKGIFGVAPTPDHHNPLFLAHVSDSLFGADVENTGAGQLSLENSITATFRGNGNQFAFEVNIDEPSIIIGVTSYDIERAYPLGIERSFFTKDRYDMFLPQLQYVGDQPVYRAELDGSSSFPMNPFGYQFRDMDRKQLINRARGGFASGSLPGFAFMYSRAKLLQAVNISPDFIRSYNEELDQFYLSLTGYSLGTYFHFIVVSENEDNASRPMAVNPQILG